MSIALISLKDWSQFGTYMASYHNRCPVLNVVSIVFSAHFLSRLQHRFVSINIDNDYSRMFLSRHKFSELFSNDWVVSI